MPDIKILSNEKPVCADHGCIVCGRCYLDLSFAWNEDDVEGDYKEKGRINYGIPIGDSDDNSNDYGHIVKNETLGPDESRFIPQQDWQLTAARHRTRTGKKPPPKPAGVSILNPHYCQTCQLTWLEGYNGSEVELHPSHTTRSNGHGTSHRSLLVFVDGACSRNGQADAEGGYGVYFGDKSKYNFSGYLPQRLGRATSQKAELQSLLSALEIVRKRVVPEYREAIIEWKFHGRDFVPGQKPIRLVIATDSSYVVEGLCRHVKQWTLDPQSKKYINRAGQEIRNSDGFLAILKEVERLAVMGVQVVYYHVSRSENTKADHLARMAIIPIVLGAIMCVGPSYS